MNLQFTELELSDSVILGEENGVVGAAAEGVRRSDQVSSFRRRQRSSLPRGNQSFRYFFFFFLIN